MSMPVPVDHVQFKGDMAIFSNFTECSHDLTLNFDHIEAFVTGKSRSSEKLYQASKARTAGDAHAILSAPTPRRAKKLAATLVKAGKARTDWSDALAREIMLNLIQQKFAEGTPEARKLLETDPSQLVEWNYWCDITWGRCTCPKHHGEGQDWLGGILREHRTLLLATKHPKGGISTNELLSEPVLARLKRAYLLIRTARETLIAGRDEYAEDLDASALSRSVHMAIKILEGET